MSIEILGDGVDGNVTESSLLFCKLPPRKSVTALDEQPRLSYYSSNEKQAVPFKWEASPGKPMISKDAARNPESPRVAPLRPPPGSGGLRSRRVSSELSREDEFDRANFFKSQSAAASAAPPTLPKSHQRPRLPPKNRMLGRLPQPSSSNVKNTIASSNGTRDPGSNSNNSLRPGHRRSTESDDSFTSCGRSDFDWPEVSDEEEYGTPPQEQEQQKRSSGSNGSAAAPRAGGGGAHAKEEQSFSSSRSSLSSISTTSSPAHSGGSRGGSARELMLWRNLVNIAAAQAVGPHSASYAVPFKPSYGGVESYSEEDEAEDADVADHVRPPGRGFLSCMPIFSRMIHSQSTSKAAEKPATIDFANRLAPGTRNKTYRS